MKRMALAAFVFSCLLATAVCFDPMAPDDHFESGMSSLGLSNESIDDQSYTDVEYVINHTLGDPFDSCPFGFALAVAPSLEPFKDVACVVGARHEADASAPLLRNRRETTSAMTLEFNWYLNEKQIGAVDLSLVKPGTLDFEKNDVLRLPYHLKYLKGNLEIVFFSDKAATCCMRRRLSNLNETFFPRYPLIGMGRHSLNISGKVTKDVPYVFYRGSKCPKGYEHAIITDTKIVVPGNSSCWVAAGRSRVIIPSQEPTNIAAMRGAFEWNLDGSSTIPLRRSSRLRMSPTLASIQIPTSSFTVAASCAPPPTFAVVIRAPCIFHRSNRSE